MKCALHVEMVNKALLLNNFMNLVSEMQGLNTHSHYCCGNSAVQLSDFNIYEGEKNMQIFA